MSTAPALLRCFLDAGVPDSVGEVLKKHSHYVIFHRDALLDGTNDHVVCATALLHSSILVAADNDMKRLAQEYGVTPTGDRFQNLSIIRLVCPEPQAANRLEQALDLIDLEWKFAQKKRARRMWVDVGAHYMKTHR